MSKLRKDDKPYTYTESVSDFYEILGPNEHVVVIYSAHWCLPCRKLKELLEQKYKHFPYPIVIVDVDNIALGDISDHVKGMPTIEFMTHAKLEKRVEGFAEQEIVEHLDKWMAEHIQPLTNSE